MNPLWFLLFLAGAAAGIVGTIVFFATRRPPPPPRPPVEDLPPTIALTVTPRNFCVGSDVRIQWSSNGTSTRVTANRPVPGFPSTDAVNDVMARIDEEGLTEFMMVSTNGTSQPRTARERTTGHRGDYVIEKSGDAMCRVDQRFPHDERFENPNVRSFQAVLTAEDYGEMRAVRVEISPYPHPSYPYRELQSDRFSLYHDNVLVIPEGQQIADYNGFVVGEWKVVTLRWQLHDLPEPDEPCSPNDDQYTPLVVGFKIRVACS